MFNYVFVTAQCVLPQHFLSLLAGWLAESRVPWLKNWLINQFIQHYKVDMSEAIIENPQNYPSFNSFFTRELKPNLRPIAPGPETIISPVDGIVAEIGQINKDQLLQAKGLYFDLTTLLGDDKELASHFQDGTFTTFYLAPNNYHGVHMPSNGKLVKTIYIPGKLFSVNRMTSQLVPNLYSRNERLITIFNTDAGPMAIILVGALIVGSIQTVWKNNPIRQTQRSTDIFQNGIEIAKGNILGHFKLGSTVILLYGKNKMTWSPLIKMNLTIKYGQFLGNFI